VPEPGVSCRCHHFTASSPQLPESPDAVHSACGVSGVAKEAIIKKGAPLELIETALSDDELFGEPKANSVIYPEAVVPLSAQVVIRS